MWTRRENERDRQGEKKMRDHTGKGRNWKHVKNLGVTKKDQEEYRMEPEWKFCQNK